MVRVNEKSSMRSYAFGPWVLRSDWLSGQEGRAVHLPPKELAVLRQLLDADGLLISKDALLDSVWPTSDVAEESLTRCIYSLRKLLGENKNYIASVYGKGYRLTCTAVQLNDSQAKPLAPSLMILPFRGAETRLIDDLHDHMVRRLTHVFAGEMRVMPASLTADQKCVADVLGVVERLAPDFYMGGRCAWVNDSLQLSVELVRTNDHVVLHTRAVSVRDMDEAAEVLVSVVAQRIPGVRSNNESCSSYPLALAYLSGRMGLQTYTPQSLREALQHFRQCVRLDDRYAPPWSGLAEAWLAQAALGLCSEPRAFKHARVAINKALALEPGNHSALLRLALLTSLQGHADAAEALFRRALFSGDHADAYYHYAWHQWICGQESQAAKSIDICLRHDSGSVAARILQLRIAGHQYLASGQTMARQALNEDLPDHPVMLGIEAILSSESGVRLATGSCVCVSPVSSKTFDPALYWRISSPGRQLCMCPEKLPNRSVKSSFEPSTHSPEQPRLYVHPSGGCFYTARASSVSDNLRSGSYRT